MERHITIVAATPQEIKPLIDHLVKVGDHIAFQSYHHNGIRIDVLYTGIGVMHSTYTLTEYLGHRHPDGWIQLGIGGAVSPDLNLTDVYCIESERLYNFGAEDKTGHVLSPFELGWLDENGFPFEDGMLKCPYVPLGEYFKSSLGMTVWHGHGYLPSIEKMRSANPADIESMEGAPFFYTSLLRKIPFISIRSISNHVEERNKLNWKIPEAIESLNASFIAWADELEWNIDRLFHHRQG